MLRNSFGDAGDEIDPKRVFAQHGIYRNGGAGMPLAELGLQKGDVRVAPTPLEVWPSREVDSTDQLYRLRELGSTVIYGGIRHLTTIAVGTSMRRLMWRCASYRRVAPHLAGVLYGLVLIWHRGWPLRVRGRPLDPPTGSGRFGYVMGS